MKGIDQSEILKKGRRGTPLLEIDQGEKSQIRVLGKARLRAYHKSILKWSWKREKSLMLYVRTMDVSISLMNLATFASLEKLEESL